MSTHKSDRSDYHKSDSREEKERAHSCPSRYRHTGIVASEMDTIYSTCFLRQVMVCEKAHGCQHGGCAGWME
ncbi:hypothetical protein EYF80_034528 [Liparis tanakae]|uniref:Uncharacterized protein n=1 Tax=Liparis tanakae TaxID=230148 RepID=A0A4Z2GRC4_9TELE|nr:hypothetical protein EYF80_034528 [Liparis tanakae]